MKTNEQELALLGLKEINESERNEVKGGEWTKQEKELYHPFTEEYLNSLCPIKLS